MAQNENSIKTNECVLCNGSGYELFGLHQSATVAPLCRNCAGKGTITFDDEEPLQVEYFAPFLHITDGEGKTIRITRVQAADVVDRFPANRGAKESGDYSWFCDVDGHKIGSTLDGIHHIQGLRMQLAEQPSLRDQFAMAALTGLLAARSESTAHAMFQRFHPTEDAEYVYKIADAMLEARKPTLPPPPPNPLGSSSLWGKIRTSSADKVGEE